MAKEEKASFLRPDSHLFMCCLKIEGCSYEGSVAII